jgi:hypothetical protein
MSNPFIKSPRPCTWINSLFLNARAHLHILSIVTTPIVIACLAAIVLAAAPQVLEVYRATAIDILSPAPVGIGISGIILRYLSWCSSLGALLLLAGTFFVSSTSLLLRFAPKSELTLPAGRWTERLAPVILALAPLVALLSGCYGAIKTVKEISGNEDILDRLAFEISYKAGIAHPSSSLLTSFRQTASEFFVSVDQALYAAMGGTLLLVAVAVFVWYRTRIYLAPSPRLAELRFLANLAGTGLLAMIVTLIAFVVWPIALPQALGPITIICLFFIFLQVGFVTLSFLSQELRFPLTFLALAWIAVLSLLGCNDNHELRWLDKAKRAPLTARPSLKECLAVWFASRPDRGPGQRFAANDARYPVYIVAAQGGGIYAAHHSATFLAGLQQRVPQFQHHLFAISGISGGSFGSSLFAAALDLQQVTEGRVDADRTGLCAAPQDPAPPAAAVAPKLNVLDFIDDEVLGKDFLSPLLGAAAFPDFLQRFIPYPVPSFDRARALEFGLKRAWDFAVDETVAEKTDEFDAVARAAVKNRDSLLDRPYSTHWDATGSLPALILNTTDVRSGTRRVFSPFEFGNGAVQFFSPDTQSSTRLVTAAVLSARFPWITPAGWIRDGQDNSISRYVDGGYFESSGMVTALQLYDAVQSAAAELGLTDRLVVKILALTFDPDNSAPRMRFGGLDEIDDPIQTLLSTWAARGWSNVRDAERRLNTAVDFPVVRVTLNPIRNPLPLGWMISYATRRFILIQRGAPERCQGPHASITGMGHPFDADCAVANIIHDLVPKLP